MKNFVKLSNEPHIKNVGIIEHLKHARSWDLIVESKWGERVSGERSADQRNVSAINGGQQKRAHSSVTKNILCEFTSILFQV